MNRNSLDILRVLSQVFCTNLNLAYLTYVFVFTYCILLLVIHTYFNQMVNDIIILFFMRDGLALIHFTGALASLYDALLTLYFRCSVYSYF